MSRPVWMGLLLASGLAVGRVGWLVHEGFFSVPVVSELLSDEWGDGEEDDETAPLAAEAIDPAAVDAWLRSLPAEAWSRDPFGPASAVPDRKPTSATPFEGTLIGRRRRVAWIGGIPHGIGDAIGGWTIERIEPGALLIERDGRRRELRAGELLVGGSGEKSGGTHRQGPRRTGGSG